MIDNDFSNTGCSLIISGACRAAGFIPRYVARSDDHHTALAFVASGIGITLLPALAVPEGMAGVESREVVNPTPTPQDRRLRPRRLGAQPADPASAGAPARGGRRHRGLATRRTHPQQVSPRGPSSP